MIGFSETDGEKLWGNLKKDPKEVIELSGGEGAGNVIYLRGKVFDSFDGQEWSKTETKEAQDIILDSLETLCAVEDYDGEWMTDYLRNIQIGVRYMDFHSKYIFLPLKTLQIPKLSGEEKTLFWGGELLSDETLGYGTEYEISYLRINQEHQLFREFAGTKRRMERLCWDRTVQKYAKGQSGVSFEDYLSYREKIYSSYLPGTEISDRLESYLEKLFEGAGNPYEKLLRLEEVLNAFSYTDTPGRYPDDIDSPGSFLDYFMFQTQEGYCSYFATAFVLIARNQGIPARFVQGYYVTKKDGIVSVTSDMAHAWPEVYLDGIGWIGFEPTPGRKSRTAWETAKRVREDSLKREGNFGSGGNRGEEEALDQAHLLMPQLEEDGKQDRFVDWFRVLVSVFLSIFVIVIFVLADRAVAGYRYRRMDEKGKFLTISRKNFKLLKYLGFSLQDGETLQEFRERITAAYPEITLSFMEFYEILIYAETEAAKDMRTAAEKENEELKTVLRKKKKWLSVLLRS